MDIYNFSTIEQNVLEGMPQPLAVYQYSDGKVSTLALSDGFCSMFGYTDRDKAYRDMNTDVFLFNHPDDVDRVARATGRFIRGEERLDIVYRTRDRSGKGYRIIHATGDVVSMTADARIAYVWYIDEGLYEEGYEDQESAFRRSLNNALHEESLLRASQFDRLTGLPSMTYFFQLAENGKVEIMKDGSHAVLLYFDLNGMKFFNSRHSFAEGDRLLQSFAQLLINTFGLECCCHIGADHFAAYAVEDGIEELLEQLFRECQNLNNHDSLPVRVGISSTSLEDVPVSLACDRAKYACDTLKNVYHSAFSYFSMEMKDDALRRQYVLSHIDQAVENGWIQAYYQPIVRSVNGRVCDEEALARWIDPVMGFLSPADFIPSLEDAGLIYKLDLCIVDQVLAKIKHLQSEGLDVVPQSVNLSRSDFSSCDIVEEIRRRVDEAGVSHSLITVEVTESLLGRNFEFMKSQIERFKELGFGVWLDDFGSGYSSMDVLQTIDFDLVKFDMSFMRRLNEGDRGRILLTELMRMMNALDNDTVCEGVETKEQVDFLQEIGCSKMQGYYFTKPVPLDEVLERYKGGFLVGFEDPRETDYYESIGRVNLYDLSVAGGESDSALINTYSTLPMGIMELADDSVKFIRSNQSYRDFMMRFFGHDLSDHTRSFVDNTTGPGAAFLKHVKVYDKGDRLSFFDEQMPDGSNVHSFTRRVAVNPVTGNVALAVSVLSVTDVNEGATYAGIARALAADYYNIYYVDMETDRFIEYSSPVGGEDLAMERHGENFFDAVKRDAMTRIYEGDREAFLRVFTKEKIIRELDSQGVFNTTYRLIDTGEPVYASMKITRMLPDERRIIIGISINDSQMKRREEAEKRNLEETAYARVMALSGDYLGLYTIDPDTGRYYRYIETEDYRNLGLSESGEDFFTQGMIDANEVVHPEDLQMYIREFTRENILDRIRSDGVFQIHYRLIINGKQRPVSLKIVKVTEKDGEKLIAGVRAWADRH